jgi:hypothetical protein
MPERQRRVPKGTARPQASPITHVALQPTIEDTVRSLGYELVELERSAGGCCG